MDYNYFDIHSHLYFKDYDKDRQEEIEKIKKAKIGTITIGTGFETSQEAVDLAENNENIFACIGQHPGNITRDSVFDERLGPLADNKNVVAIGECGLDYFRMDPGDTELKIIQKTIFEYHIDLALEKELPVMLHIRGSKGTHDAYLDALEILEHHAKISGDKLTGNAHFFAGNLDILKRFLAIGFTVSFTGVITFTHDYDEFVRYAPMERIMSETDAPFVTPAPHRKERNSPLHIPLIVEKIAQIRREPLDDVKETLISNTYRVFPKIKA